MVYNSIDDEAVRSAANFLTYQQVKKGEYVFKQGDVSKHFYGVIQGKISLRTEIKSFVEVEQRGSTNFFGAGFFPTSTNNIGSQKRKTITKEILNIQEIVVRTDGYCFGEWGLIYRAPRSTAAYAIEDTDLFVIEEDYFNASFSKSLSKAEIDRRNFLVKKVPPFEEIQYSKFNLIYKTIVPMFLNKNQLVYLENSPANQIFVVFMGCCRLEKNIIKLPEENENDIHKMKFVTLLKIDKGDIIGLEALSSKNYKYTLKSDSEYTVLLCIKLEKLEESLQNKLKHVFNPLFVNFERNVSNILQKKKELSMNGKLTYKKDAMLKQIKNLKMNKDEEKLFQKKIDEKVKEVKDENIIQSENALKNFTVKSFKKSAAYSKFVKQTLSKASENCKKENELQQNFAKKFSMLIMNKLNSNDGNILETENQDERHYFLTYLNSNPISPTKTINKFNDRIPSASNAILKTMDTTSLESGRESFALDNSKNRVLGILKFDKTRTNSALVGSNKTHFPETHKNRNYKKTVTILTTESQSTISPNNYIQTTSNVGVNTMNTINTEPSPSREATINMNLERLNSLVSYTFDNKNKYNYNNSRPMSALFSAAESFISKTNINHGHSNERIDQIAVRRRRGFTLKEKRHLLSKNMYAYEKDPIILGATVKKNLKNWGKVLQLNMKYDSGRFSMPLVCLTEK